MQSFEIHQARTGETQVDVSDGVTRHTATGLALSDDQLDKFRAFLVQLVFAIVLVHLVNFVVAASEASESLEAHLVGVAQADAGRDLMIASFGDCDASVSISCLHSVSLFVLTVFQSIFMLSGRGDLRSSGACRLQLRLLAARATR